MTATQTTAAKRTIATVKAELREIGKKIDAAVIDGEDSLSIALLTRMRYELADEMRALQDAAKARSAKARTYEFGDEIRFTNRWGQENQIFTVMSQDGDRVYGDYLGIGNLFDLTTMQIIPTDSLGHPIVEG